MKELSLKWKRAIMVVCVIGFCLLQALIMLIDRRGMSNLSGVVMALMFVMCLILVQTDHKVGLILSVLLCAYAMAHMLIAIIMRHMFTPVPGVMNMSIYVITLFVLSRQFTIRDKQILSDHLTGLCNRRGLYQILEEKADERDPFFVVYIDLGNFKFINDNYGHTYGDRLLQEVTARMSDVVEHNGVLTRIGGDEFVVVLNGNCDPGQLTENLLTKVCQKISLEQGKSMVDCYLTAFAGISRFPEDSKDPESLIKYADIAMYRASKEKDHRVVFFDKNMERMLERRIELEKLIKLGLEQKLFYMVYQPQYEIDGKKLRGFESLLRLKTASGEFVSPAEFIPVAEKGDLILNIDEYVLNRVTREFRDIVLENRELVVSVNVSAKNIGNFTFPGRVRELLEDIGFPAENLEIEITEYCLVQSVDVAIDNIRELREMGIRVALDDFGTGYTSLSYLSKMPINLLKLDKSLVDDIETNPQKQDFVKAVISLGHLMGCEVISEGVESQNQVEMLEKQQCDLIQGYVWGRPMELGDAKNLALKGWTD